jgi:hypothetical protein
MTSVILEGDKVLVKRKSVITDYQQAKTTWLCVSGKVDMGFHEDEALLLS